MDPQVREHALASISNDYVAKRPPITFGGTGECVIADPGPCREASPQEPLPEYTLGYDVNENTNKNKVKNCIEYLFLMIIFIIYFKLYHKVGNIKKEKMLITFLAYEF